VPEGFVAGVDKVRFDACALYRTIGPIKQKLSALLDRVLVTMKEEHRVFPGADDNYALVSVDGSDVTSDQVALFHTV
jgi:hypothetical protein